MFRVCLHFESRYVGHTHAEDIWDISQIFSGLLTHNKNIFLSWHAEYCHFAIQRWRYLHISLYCIFSCCVSCNGLPLGIVYFWNILEKNCIYIYIHIPSSKPWKLKLKRTKQTEWVERTGQLPDWHYGFDQADLTDYINGIVLQDRTERTDCNPEDPLTLVCWSCFPKVWGGGGQQKKKTYFFLDPPLREV